MVRCLGIAVVLARIFSAQPAVASAIDVRSEQGCPCLQNGGQPGPGECPCNVEQCFGDCVNQLCPGFPQCMLECSSRCSCYAAPECVTHVDPGPTPTQPRATTTPPDACDGDCDGDGTVTVAELIRGVAVALGSLSVNSCPAYVRCLGEGNTCMVIQELISAVRAALFGCPGNGASPTLTFGTVMPATPEAPPPTATVTPATPIPDGVLVEVDTAFRGLCGQALYNYTQPTDYGYYGYCSPSGTSVDSDITLRIVRFDDITAATAAFAEASRVGPPDDFADLPAAYWERGFALPNDGGTRTMVWQLDCWVVAVRSHDNYGGRLALAPRVVSQAILDAAGSLLADRCPESPNLPTPTPTRSIGPDLLVSGIAAYAIDAVCERRAVLQVCVANAGRAAADSFVVTVSPGNDQFSLPDLQAGGERCVGGPLPFSEPFAIVTIEADANGQIDEIDETTNALTERVMRPRLEATCIPTRLPTATASPSP